MSDVQLKAFHRDGKIALFIDGYNVQDLTKAELTKTVKDAILYAYELGVEHTRRCLQLTPDFPTIHHGDSFPEPVDYDENKHTLKR